MRKLLLALSLLAICLWPLSGVSAPDLGNPGGYQTLNGINAGGAATEEGIKFLYNLKRIVAPERTGGFTTIYVSSQAGGHLPLGVDTNVGRASAPIRTLSKVKEVIDERGCGLEFVFDDDVWTGATDFAAGLNGLITECTNADEIAIYLRSIDPDSRATFDPTGGSPVSGVIAVTTGTDGGWVVVEGIHIANATVDAFSISNAAKMVVVNSGTYRAIDAANSFTSHGTSTLIGINVYGHGTPIAGTNVMIIPADTSNLIIISDKTFLVDSEGNNRTGTVLNGLSGNLMAIGLDITEGDSHVGIFRGINDTGTLANTSVLTAIRVNIHGDGVNNGDDGVYTLVSHADADHTIRILQSQIMNMEGRGFMTTPSGGAGVATIYARCLVLDELGREIYYDAQLEANSDVDIQYVVYDETDKAADDWMTTGSGETILVDAAANVPNWTAFFTNSTDSNDEIQWDADNNLVTTTDTIPNYGCNPNMDCWDFCDLTFEETLPAAIPEFVADREISSVILNGTDGTAGGR